MKPGVDAREQRQELGARQGDGVPCYYCGEPCNGLAGNPGLWPIPLAHRDDPGRVKYHHIRCVSNRLIENVMIDGETFQDWIEDATKWREHRQKLLGRLEFWSFIWSGVMIIGAALLLLASFMYPHVVYRLPLAFIGFGMAMIGWKISARFKVDLRQLAAQVEQDQQRRQRNARSDS